MPGVRSGRKTDMRQDVDALTKSVAEMRATVEDVHEIIKGQLRESRDAVRALEGMGGRPPLRVLEILVNADPYAGGEMKMKRMAVHWTPVGLLLTENGKQYVTNGYSHTVAITGPVGRFRG